MREKVVEESNIDARKPLTVLKAEWENCTACSLGARRTVVGGHFVLGEGTTRAIMFIADGPSEVDEFNGRPFTGPAGELLHGIMQRYKCPEYYVTNTVSCRSCEPMLDKVTGLPVQRRGLPKFMDIPPLPVQAAACRNRLLEEIYIVDPIVILTLGVPASEAVLGRSITITKERGRAQPLTIPGALRQPVLTDTKKAWRRKLKGNVSWPTEPSEIRYLVIPTVSPSFVLRKSKDLTERGPFSMLQADIHTAIQIYERYLMEVHKMEPRFVMDADFSDMEEMENG